MNSHRLKNVINNLTGRSIDMFDEDLKSNELWISEVLFGSSVIVIGGAGTIGRNYIKRILHYRFSRLVVIDHNENGLAELIRDIRSSNYTVLPEIRTYAMDFGSDLFHQFIKSSDPFDIVANFAATKHVRSEKDIWSIIGMLENNVIKNFNLLKLLQSHPPKKFFAVSTDKATNPVNFMGASKRAMEVVITSFKDEFDITSGRFANVAFSNGSLLASFISKFFQHQTLVCPNDIKRYFVSPSESGSLCLLASILGKSGDIFIPNLSPEDNLVDISNSLYAFLNELNLEPIFCDNDKDALRIQKHIPNLIQEGKYPVYLTETNTSGEKLYEEFYTEDETVDWSKFVNLGVVTTSISSLDEVNLFIKEWHKIKTSSPSKNEFMNYLNALINNFSHSSSDINLDDKL